MADIIQIRRGTAAQWTATNPILADGELGFETDTLKGKLGNGVTAWASLPYSWTGSIPDSVATQINAASTKAIPVGGDRFGFTDSDDGFLLKKLTWSNILTALNLLYASVTHNQNASTIQAGTFASGNFVFPANLDVTGQLATPVFAKGNSTGAVTVNWNQGNVQSMTLTGNVTLSFSNPKSGGPYQLIITQDTTGSRTITWPTMHWAGKSVPSLTGTLSSKDIVTITYDGTNYNAVISKNHGV